MKKEILQTSLKQFLKHGIRKMSVQKLIEPLGISTKTVYKYFKNKEELLEDALHLYHSQQYEMLENLSVDQNATTLFFDIWYKSIEVEYKVNKAFFHDLHYYYPELGKKIEAAIGKKFVHQFIHVIQKGIKDGDLQEGIIPEVILEATFILYNAVIREGKFKSYRVSPFDILLNTIAIYIRGFCTVKGAKQLDEHIKIVQSSGGVIMGRKTVAPNDR